MKKDNLEKYIDHHRADFDNNSPPADLWSRIETEMDQSKAKVINVRRLASIAAAVVVVLGVGVIVGLRLGGDSEVRHQAELNEFVEAEDYYSNQYRVKWGELQTAGVEIKSIEEDLQQLDAVYNELKSELLQNPDLNTPKVVNALISNYRTKIEILETVIDRTKKQNLQNLNIDTDELDKI